MAQPAPARQGEQGQDPGRKIDQREPVLLDVGPRNYRGLNSRVRVIAEVGVGSVQVIAPRTTLRDRTDATFVRVGLDGEADDPSGPALHITGFSSDDNLFHRSLMNNGQAPANADGRVAAIQAFPHLRFTALQGTEWAMPVRVGVSVGYTDMSHRSAKVDRDWLTVGPRLEVEPHLALLGDDDHGLDLTGRLTGAIGYGTFREQYQGGDDNDSMAQWDYSVGLGLRWHMRDWWLDLGYDFGQNQLSHTDTALFGRREVRMESQNLHIGGSVRF